MSRFLAMSLTVLTGLFLAPSLQAASEQVVKGVYRNTLYEYSESGAKLGVLENVSDEQISGTKILDRTPRGLVKVRFLDRDMWLRESSLKLSIPVLPPCPQEAPGQSADLTTPTSSGMSARCSDR